MREVLTQILRVWLISVENSLNGFCYFKSPEWFYSHFCCIFSACKLLFGGFKGTNSKVTVAAVVSGRHRMFVTDSEVDASPSSSPFLEGNVWIC